MSYITFYILLVILIILFIRLLYINKEHFIDNKYNCKEVQDIQNNYFKVPLSVSINACDNNVAVFDDDGFDISKITNNYKEINADLIEKIDNKKKIKLARIKTYFELPDYKAFNVEIDNNYKSIYESNINNTKPTLKNQPFQPLNFVN